MSKTQRDISVRCAFCGGKGHDPFALLSPPSACQVCLGRGVVDVPEPRVPCAYCRGLGIAPHTRLTCSSCGGRGAQTVREPHATCHRCGGDGADPASERGLSCLDCHGAGVVRAAALALCQSRRLRPSGAQPLHDGRKQFAARARAGYLDVGRQDPRCVVLEADEQYARAA
jgi:DnaJ-class molecular chaperone